MERILAAYDGSETARHALVRAIDLAQHYQAALTVLTAADRQYENSPGDWTAAADEGLAHRVAEEGAQQARAAGLARVETRVCVEAPADAITLEAREGYDCVVVGHRGHRPIRDLLLGSTAKSIIDRIECSVLVVR